tara:strand:+ start:158 stop:538 length:381 start_codon:yes stop_codon:yes gene_type:complete
MANEFSVTTNQEALLYRIWKGLTAGGIIPASPTNNTLGQGRKVVTTAGTAVALSSSTSCKSVTIQAEKDNTSDVVIGGLGVVGSLATRQGIYLSPGDSVDFPIDNLDKIYLDSLVNGEGVTYIYFN